MADLLIEILIKSDTAAIGAYMVEGDSVIGPFGMGYCSTSSGYDNIPATLAEVWPSDLEIEKVFLSSNFKPLTEILAKEGARPTWFRLSREQPFDESLVEKWAIIKTYGRTKKGEISKRATLTEYVRTEDLNLRVGTKSKPKDVLTLFADDTGCDWMTKRYSAQEMTDLSENQEVVRVTTYQSFNFVEKFSRAGKPYMATVKAPHRAASPWQVLDRLAFAHGGYRCVHREAGQMRMSRYMIQVFAMADIEEIEV